MSAKTNNGIGTDPQEHIMLNHRACYLQVVSWSEEDQCWVDRCPGVMGSCCRGADNALADADSERMVAEWLELHQRGYK